MKCSTPHCRHRAGKKKGGKCYQCAKRAERQKHPLKAQWRRLKSKAKQRGIIFCLPFWYFEIFAMRCSYIAETGNGAGCITVDRVNNLLGYVVGNIQPLTREQNIEKQWQRDYRRFEAGYAWRV